jgi:hypothetical protein
LIPKSPSLGGWVGIVSIFAAGLVSASQSWRLQLNASGEEAAAFVVAGGREVVSLAVAGTDLGRIRLTGREDAPLERMADRVSRLVIFRFRDPVGKGLELAAVTPESGELVDRPGGRGFPIQRRVKRVERAGGAFLPFTMLRLGVTGPVPVAGTPLLDGSGRVAAVVHEPAGQGAIYAVPVEVLRRVLDDARDGVISKAWVGIVLDANRGGLRVLNVEAGSPAAHAGVRVGDILQEIAGHRLSDYGDAVNALYLLIPGEPVWIKVRRGAGEVMLGMEPRARSGAG